jgi:hypothetical protein
MTLIASAHQACTAAARAVSPREASRLGPDGDAIEVGFEHTPIGLRPPPRSFRLPIGS